MVTVHHEVESKLDADEAFTMPSLVELVRAPKGGSPPVAGAAVPLAEGEVGELALAATYFDTADLRLAAAGLTLRRRTGGEDAGWHLKVPSVAGGRSEIRLPLEAGDTTVPAELAHLVHARTGGAALVPVVRLETTRTVRHLVDPTGRVLLEVADDRVTARRVFPSDSPGDVVGAATAWREVEVELVDGDAALLEAVSAGLRERGLRPAASTSKLARALGVTLGGTGDASGADGAGPDEPGSDPAAPDVLGPDAPASEVVLAYLAAEVERLRAADLPVRLDAPDSVHAMRVATRRLRSTLKTFRPLLDRTVTTPLRAELRWLGRVLSAARDAEVVRDRVVAALGDDGGEAAPPAAVLDEVHAGLDAAYRTAHDDVVEQLGGARYRALLDALTALLDDPPLTDRAARPAGTVLPRRVRRALAAVAESMDAAHAAPDPGERLTRLHDARKSAKRARYAAEALAPAFGDPARELAAAMEQVQETLGEHLDSVHTRRRLRELAAGTPSAAAAFALGRLHAAEEARAPGLESAADAAWTAASRKRLRRWLR